MKSNWTEILLIWLAVAGLTVISLVQPQLDENQIEASFGAILAGSIATVSLVQLFRAQAEGFVRRLVYVGGGSYLILAAATLYLVVRG